MQHNDIRHSMCYGCACFMKEEFSGKYACLESGQPLRVGKHKVPLKHQDCKGPHDDFTSVVLAFDEFRSIPDEMRAELYTALENGIINKGTHTISPEIRAAIEKAWGRKYE